jgi:hypothetical protein
MEWIILGIEISSYILVIITILLAIFIYATFIFSDKIVKWKTSKIKETRREVIKIILQDLSLFIQVCIGIGISLLLFSLSKTGVQVMLWGFLGIVMMTAGIFLIFWRYIPLRNKMYETYNKK